MSIDERLEKLTERHEAMAQSMELLQSMYEKRFDSIAHNFNVALDSIRSLERIASAHEARITHLEGD